MTYPTSPDYASGRFRGPIDAPTNSFPDASPTNQIYATPPPNPYTADMETLAMQLAALPPLF